MERISLKVSLVACLVFSGACAPTPPDPGGLQINTIEYSFVGNRGQIDDDGRTLVWEASAEGDLGTEMRWWFYDPPPAPVSAMSNATVTYYQARWEILSESELLIAGESAGKTVFLNESDGIWDGHGVVTEAQSDLEHLIGNRIYETGPVELGSNPPLSYTGRGMFVIY